MPPSLENTQEVPYSRCLLEVRMALLGGLVSFTGASSLTHSLVVAIAQVEKIVLKHKSEAHVRTMYCS